ncbi:heme-copper oxidase subunit III [Myxococcota bacterium]|nr:heme-copper oxidase subunit III [Myxococcota bacterium]
MGQVLPYRSPRDAERTTAYVGMILFMGAWAMMFACLFFAYGALRMNAPYWPPVGQPVLPLGTTGANTAIIVLSSVALELGIVWTRRGKTGPLAAMIAVSALLGAAFVAVQWLIGADLFAAGLHPGAGPYAAVFYGLAGIHGLHVVIGIGALAWLALKAARGAYSAAHHLPVRLWSMYWHFVGAVWLFMYVFVFVV